MVDLGFPDNGRQIQASFYRQGIENYPQGCWACDPGCHWGWNAVMAGSCNPLLPSGYYNLVKNSDSIFIQTQPHHWDDELGVSSFFLGEFLEFLSFNTLRINYQMWNSEPLATGNKSHHELPVVYLEPFLSVPKGYFGGQPFTGAPVTTLSVPSNDGVTLFPTEPWLGWFGSSGGGVALYVPSDAFYGQTWRMGRIGSPSPPTNYVQNWANISIVPNTAYSADAFIVTGTLEEIRAVVYELEGYGTPPAQPAWMALAIPGPSGSNAYMSWGPATGADDYEIEARWRPLPTGAWVAWADIATVSAPATEYYYTYPVAIGFRYQTRVRAVNANGASAWRTSNTVDVP